MNSELIFLKLAPEHIVTIKFILESYEGLGVVRTLNAEKGEIVFLAPSDSHADLLELVESLKEDLGLRIIPMPTDLTNDWLISEFVNN